MSGETRICHICGGTVGAKEFCPTCTENVKHLPDPEGMTGEERAAELSQWYGPLEIPFDLMHARFEALLGRPVYTHEMAIGKEQLIAETALPRGDDAERQRRIVAGAASLAEAIPPERIIAVSV